MAAIVDSLRVPTQHDKRRKLSDEDKLLIRELSAQGQSQRKLANQFGVSRRLIQFIIDPAKLQANRQSRLDRGGEHQYYDKDKHTQYMQTHRANKKALLEADIITKD